MTWCALISFTILLITEQLISASLQWNNFASSKYYANTKMITKSISFFPARYISKERTMVAAQLDCAYGCAANQSCLAFNFHDDGTSYVCEMLPDNFCVDKLKKTLMHKTGSAVWDKLSAGSKNSCFESKFGTNPATFSCQTLQPGCSGTWPNCTSCATSCIDCYNRGLSPCVIWPDVVAPHLMKPLFVDCYTSGTYLMYRTVDLSSGKLSYDYQLSFEDMNRLYKLNLYSELQFWFGYSGGYWYYSSYRYSYIDSQGTLYNMTFMGTVSPTSRFSPAGDIFKLNGQALASVSFSQVANDIYGCGSFWVLDPNNATYCPGGNTRMWGTPILSGGTVVSTGINVPAAPVGTVFKEACIELANYLP